MSNSHFQFKQFIIHQDRCAMKVTTDACLFGAWVADRVGSWKSGVGSREPGIGVREPIVGKMLDVGTGSGLLTIMLAQKTNLSINSIEIEKDAFEQAKENAAASPWARRLYFFHADAKKFAFPSQYDFIICNPPFYENELPSENNKKNLAHHSDSLALGEILFVIKKNLKADGLFFLLLPFKRNVEIKNILLEHAFNILQITFVRQSVTHGYFRMMLIGKLKMNIPAVTITDEISIWNDQREYTPEFTNLLKDYYLYL